ncbi:MAG: TetR/AcrR family transcriptional regulator [Pseudomonadota bacterium]
MASRAQQAEQTRARILETARALFAERGFYGVSTGQVSAALGMSKQGVLHYFSTKERLYGEVLRMVSTELEAALPDLGKPTQDSKRALIDTFVSMIPNNAKAIERTRLLVRELLDNRIRASESGVWYLSNFLARLVEMLRACEGWEEVAEAEAQTTIFQWLGAIEYSTISRPTLRGIYGEKGSANFWQVFAQRLERLIVADLASGATTRR